MIGVVVPTIRIECLKRFIDAWAPLFYMHNTLLVTVHDGDEPFVTTTEYYSDANKPENPTEWTPKEIMGEYLDVIFNKNDGIRNLGFAHIARRCPEIETIITLDDDTLPYGYTIGNHLAILGTRVPLSWISTASEYMRGMPYGIRDEAEVVISHGIWHGVADYDAPTQLVNGNRPVNFYKGPIPRGIFAPVCFLPGQLITMADGTVWPIEKICPGQEVITDGNEVHPVVKTMEREVNEVICTIKLAGNKEPIRVTEDHEFLTPEGWIPAYLLTAKDWLLAPRTKFEETNFTDDDLYVLGLFLAEGSFSKSASMASDHKRNGVVFTLNSKEESSLGLWLHRFFMERFDKLAGIHQNKNRTSISYEFFGKDIADWFHQHCGEYAEGKIISQEVLRSCNIKYLLRGLFHGDGHVGTNYNRPHVTLKTISRDLAFQVRYLLNTFGIYAPINEYMPSNRVFAQYQISLYGENAISFIQIILEEGVDTSKKQNSPPLQYRVFENYVGHRIESITKENYRGLVYNLNVQDNHTYLVNGVVVHNCGMNLAFQRKALPLCYYAPMGKDIGVERFSDIWMGITAKQACDARDWAIVTGYAAVKHERASNVYKNLQAEAVGIEINEQFWQGDRSHSYFKLYAEKQLRWNEYLDKYGKNLPARPALTKMPTQQDFDRLIAMD